VKIVRLEAENLKRLRAVEIEPDGNVVVISGRNGQGKTSVLDAIWFALGGGPAMRDTARPIRDGAEHASVALDLGDIRVTRTWSGEKTSLKVESADGARYNSPQQMLDGLVGRLSFDPLAFAQQDEKSQLATLLSLVELPFDPKLLDGQRRALYEDRTVIGREVKTLEGHLAGLPEADGDVPAEEVNAADLIGDLRRAQDALRHREQTEKSYHESVARVQRLRAEFAAAKAEMDDLAEQVASLPTAPDPTSIEADLQAVDETNRKVRAANERLRVAELLEAKQGEYDTHTEKIALLDQEKADAVAAAKMPIDELGFTDDGVTYRGVPFKQASAAEQLRVSVAMALALNPTLRVIRITDGSLLDSANMALIEEMARDRDAQVWIERVSEDGQVGILIEDGSVVSVNGAPVLLGDDETEAGCSCGWRGASADVDAHIEVCPLPDPDDLARQEAANDGFLDNADPDMDLPGADDYLADVPS
jgi:hypothetical protein